MVIGVSSRIRCDENLCRAPEAVSGGNVQGLSTYGHSQVGASGPEISTGGQHLAGPAGQADDHQPAPIRDRGKVARVTSRLSTLASQCHALIHARKLTAWVGNGRPI